MRTLVVLLTVLAVPLIGCGGDGGSSDAGDDTPGDGDVSGQEAGSSSDTSGGCAVLSEAQVGEAVDAEVTGSTELPMGCMWALGDEGPDVTYEWQGLPPGGYEANQDVAGFAYEPIEGLGVEAFLRGPDTGGDAVSAEVWVRLGDDAAFFVRSTGLPNSDEVLEAKESIAGLLVAELG